MSNQVNQELVSIFREDQQDRKASGLDRAEITRQMESLLGGAA